MWYVYILRSVSSRSEEYTGVTSDLKRRLEQHNSGQSAHTSKFIPWELACYFAFPDKSVAYAFEAYLKSHSGRAFARKHLLP